MMMWSATTLRHSARHSLPSSRRSIVSSETSVRFFSDDSRNNNDRGGRGGRGRGGGRGGGGRGAGALNRFRQLRHAKKENFAKTVLEPAARGELQKNHQSGIPKLLARKGKSHKVHDDVPHAQDAQELVDSQTFPDPDDELMQMMKSPRGMRGTYETPPMSVVAPPEEEFYDSEDEYDGMLEDEMIRDLTDHPDIISNKDGSFTLVYSPDDHFGGVDDDEDGAVVVKGRGKRQEAPEQRESSEKRDPEAAYFLRRFWDNPEMQTEKVPDELYNRVLPLKSHGAGLDDFLEAHLEHPARYAEVTRYNRHPEYERQAKPDFPKNRTQPSEQFVSSHLRFLYVTGLPHVVMDGDAGDFDNPVHRYEVVKMVSGLFGVEPEHVSPSNMTSAFIGYTDKQEFYQAQRDGPSKKTFVKPVVISKYSGDAHKDFAEKSDTVVELTNLPPGVTIGKLAHSLFPVDTELGSIYGPISPDQLKITSPTTALLRFDSAEQAESAVSSAMVQRRLEELGTSRVRYFKARREVTHAGFGGPNKCREFQRRGKRLIVDGDAPSAAFYRSHAGVIHLRNLEQSVTKKDLAEMFQPFSRGQRDVTGSVEFVTCAEGLRADRAFVGFDNLGEAERVVDSCSGLFRVGNAKVAVRAVKDKHKFRLGRDRKMDESHEARPVRSEGDIIESLNNWEDFVDVEEIEELEKNGIPKEVLDNIFRTMRFHNTTFGPGDLALARERLVPERPTGDDYRETVREYIDTLKECMATPEDPGLMFNSLFFQEEEPDVSLFFDDEQVRQAELRERLKKVSSGTE